MANRVSVEISANTTGYKNAVDEAKGANQQFQSSIKNIDIKGLNREFRESGKGARGLAIELYKLEKAGKIDTTQYRQLQRELIRATKDAAELTDVVNDTNNKIRLLSSDTLNLDTFQECVGIFRDIGSAAAALGIENEGIEAGLTRLAQIQTVANAAISISNALNKDGLIIGRIKIMQDAALAKAIDLETAATGRATIAQRIFNAVAKANPYVLLASAIIAVGAAIGGYILATRNATNETEKLNQVMHETSVQGQKDAQADIVKLDLLYKATQNTSLSIEERRKATKKLQDQYPAYFSNMTTEEIMLGRASKAYQQLKNDIIAVAKAKAYQGRIEELAKENVELEDQLEKQKEITKEREKAEKEAQKHNPNPGPSPTINVSASNNARLASESRDEEKKLQNQIDANTKSMDRYANKINGASTAEERLTDNAKRAAEIERQNNQKYKTPKEPKTPKAPKTPKVEVKPITGSIEDLETQISSLQDKFRKGLIPKDKIEETKRNIKNLQSQVKTLKIQYGFEEPEKAKTELDKIVDKINTLKTNQLNIETRIDPQEYRKQLKQLEDEEQEIKIKIGLEVEPSAFEKISKVIADKLNTFNIPIEFDPNVEPSKLQKMRRELEQYTYIQENVALSDEDLAVIKEKIKDLKSDIEQEEIRIGLAPVKNEAVSTREDKISGLRDKATSIMNANGGMPEPNTDAYQQLLEIFKQIRDTQAEINALQEPLAAAEAEHNKQLEKRSKTMNDVSKAIGNIGSAMASLADEEDKGTQAAAIIVQAIANVIAGYASASAEAGGTLGPWGWAAFSIAGLAQVAATIAQIKSLSSGSYAAGGFIPGTSYYGDRLLARVNSGEAILNTQQQKRFMDIANGRYGPYGPEVAGPQQVVVTGEIDGTKILLVQRNANKVRNKSGNAITF